MMLQGANNKILISVNPKQKEIMEIAGVKISTFYDFDTNYRYRSPTVAVVESEKGELKKGDILLIHHNLCYLPSPYHLYDDLFSVPYSKVLFAKISDNGDIQPVCGNLICKEIEIESFVDIPLDHKKVHLNRYQILHPGGTSYRPNDIIFTRPSAGYTIIYNWNGIEKKAVKVDSEMICGILT